MHGIVVKGLRDHVVDSYDWRTWRSVQDRADVERRLYAPVARYPDRHGTELLDATRSLTDAGREELEYDVGRHLVPTLLQVYGVHVQGVTTGLDLLANVRAAVEEALRRKNVEGLAPPPIEGERRDDDTVLVRYGGDHCAGLRGIVAGLAEHYGTSYAVTERACRRAGDDRCELVVRRSGGAGERPASDD